ncbi:MAG TPA: response regulator [Acetobacteraceae bacterium]|nr:response regulator [Acetobacteraceae bacterium]
MTTGTDMDGLKVLIVDDEPFMRRTIKAMLRVVGRFLVEEADDGDAALALLPTFRPDIVLCDIQMPRVDGLQFVRQLRNHREGDLRETPVLMLTVSADEATILDATRLKVSGYLVKPVSPKLLGSHISAIVRTHPAEP